MLFGIRSVLISKEFDIEPVCNKNYLKTKVRLHNDEVTDFLR